MKKFQMPWNKKKNQPISLMDQKSIDTSVLSQEVKNSNIVLSGKVIYTSDIFNTVAEDAIRRGEIGIIEYTDIQTLERICTSSAADYSIVNLVILLTIPKTDQTDLFKLFSTTQELRIVYSEDPLFTYILLGSTIDGYKNLIANTKNQVNTVLTVIKNCLYETCYRWPFIDLIKIGIVDDRFIDPGVDCFWDNSEIELNIDDNALNENINKRINGSVIHEPKSIQLNYRNNKFTIYNFPSLFKIYLKHLKNLNFYLYDIIRVFGFNYINPNSGNIRYVSVYDLFKQKKEHSDMDIYLALMDDDSAIYILFGKHKGIDFDEKAITDPLCLRANESIEIDELIEEIIVEEDIPIDDGESVVIGDDEEILSGDMPIPKFDVDRYSSTRLVDDDRGEKSGKYDL